VANLLDHLNDASVLAVQGFGRDWPRPLFSQSFIPDTWQAILESPEGWRKFYAAGADPRPTDDARLTLVRARPIVIPFEVRDLASADDHDIHAAGEVLVRWPTRDDDLAALSARLRRGETHATAGANKGAPPPRAATPGASPLPVLRSSELAAHLAPALRTALRSFARRFTAETLLQSDCRNDVAAALREAMPELALEWGLVLERVNKLELRSRAYAARIAHDRDAADRRARLQTRQMLDAAALAATQQRIAGVQELLARLQAGTDGKSWRELLPALDPAERTRILRNLWRIAPAGAPARSLAAVGGRLAIWMDLANPDRVVRRIEVPATLGALRSIWIDDTDGRAYLGATTGVWEVAPDGRLTAYPAAPPMQPGHRFNAVRAAGGRIIATHPQLGVWAWSRSAPEAGVALFEPSNGRPRSIRALTFAGERLICALDDQLVEIAPGEATGSAGVSPLGPAAGSTIHALAAADREVFASCGDGAIRRLALDAPGAGWGVIEQLEQPPAGLALRTFGDLTELLIPTARRGVLAIYPHDDVRSTALPAPAGLAGNPAALNRAAAGPDALAALSPDLGRVYILTHAQADESPREVLLARLIGAAIEDVCLSTAPLH
jgi:hypothetical protein